jgi:hypothetical protein
MPSQLAKHVWNYIYIPACECVGGLCVIKQRDSFMFHVGVSSPYPVAITVVKLYEVEAVTVAWGRMTSACVHAFAKHRVLEVLAMSELNNYRQSTSYWSYIWNAEYKIS